jgi:hypothetical protein
VENVNGAVDATRVSACLDRVLAQVEVSFSNSMIWLFSFAPDFEEKIRGLANPNGPVWLSQA